MKKILLLLMSLIMMTPHNGVTHKSTAQGNQQPGSYLELDVEDTRAIFINKTKKSNGESVKNAIVFFNGSPKHNIKKILKLKYIIKDTTKTNEVYNGILNNEEMYSMRYMYNQSSFYWWYDNYPITHNHYEYDDNDSVINYNGETTTHYSGGAGKVHLRELHVDLPEIGRVSNLLQVNDFLGNYKPIRDINVNIDITSKFLMGNILYEYGDSQGYPNVREFFEERGIKKDYEFYLTLPFTEWVNLKVTYLSVSFIDENGNLYTGELNYEPITEPNKLSFKVIKENGKFTDNSTAIFVPSVNNISLSGYKINSVTYKEGMTDDEKKVYLYAGNIIQESLEEIRQNINYGLVLKDDGATHEIYYKFSTKHSSFLIDVPIDIIDISITIDFKIDENYNEEYRPYIINLLDNNGYFGIEGATPVDKDPDTPGGFWDWFSGLFNFGETNPIGQFIKILQIGAVAVLGLVILLAVIKLFGFIGLFFKK